MRRTMADLSPEACLQFSGNKRDPLWCGAQLELSDALAGHMECTSLLLQSLMVPDDVVRKEHCGPLVAFGRMTGKQRDIRSEALVY